MSKIANGFELLEELKKQNGKQIQNYSDLSRYLAIKARGKGIPYSGQFELTPLCNFNCKMCYVHLNPQQLEQSVLSPETWKKLMREAWDAGMCIANLTGGECLTYPGFDDIYLFLHSLGCQVGVLTNGFLLDEKRIQFFKEHMPHRIQITLYGNNEDVYERVTGKRAFSVVTENIRKGIEAGLPISVSITPNNFLGEDAFETVRIGFQLTESCIINSGLFSPREETGRSEQHDNPDLEMYLRIFQLRKELRGKAIKEIEIEELPPAGGPNHECKECGVRCGGGRSGFDITWKGTMVSCNRMEMICAYPLKEGFKNAWEKINREANNWPRVPECDGCPYDQVCNNCAANIMQYGEPGKRPPELCEQTRFLVSHGVLTIPECK